MLKNWQFSNFSGHLVIMNGKKCLPECLKLPKTFFVISGSVNRESVPRPEKKKNMNEIDLL